MSWFTSKASQEDFEYLVKKAQIVAQAVLMTVAHAIVTQVVEVG